MIQSIDSFRPDTSRRPCSAADDFPFNIRNAGTAFLQRRLVRFTGRLLLVACMTALTVVTPENMFAGSASDPALPESAAASESSPAPPSSPVPAVRNVILIIADGMGFPAVGLLRSYARYAPESIYADRGGVTALEQAMLDGFSGIASTEPYGVPVTDSAASGTQLASGIMALSESIGSDPDGNPVDTVLQAAKRSGRATGLVSDTRITHATPASFVAHAANRSMENEIALQMINPDTGPDVMLAAGLRYFLPKDARNRASETYRRLVEKWPAAARITSSRQDDLDLLEYAQSTGGYQVVLSRAELAAARGPRILGLFDSSGMPDGIVETRMLNDPARTWPTLPEMAVKALDVLDADPDGFFLMIEAGQIDWACHTNDAGQLLHEMLRLDRLIDAVRCWVGHRTDTVVILTADHDTGGFALTYSSAGLPIKAISKPGSLFARQDFQPGNNYGDYRVMDALYRQTMSVSTMFSQFKRLEDEQQTPQRLVAMVVDVTGVSISVADAGRILRERPNPLYIEGDDDYGDKMIPDMDEEQVFYSNRTQMICGLLARQTGIAWNIAWATGTHSAAPVPVIVLGPEPVRGLFPAVMHTTEIGRIMMGLVGTAHSQ